MVSHAAWRWLATADWLFCTCFHFPPRAGTPAARMPPVPAATIKARAAALREAGGMALARHLAQQRGRRVKILAERGGMGRAADFTPAKTPGVAPGRLFEAEIAGFSAGSLDLFTAEFMMNLKGLAPVTAKASY